MSPRQAREPQSRKASGLSVVGLAEAIRRQIRYSRGKTVEDASAQDLFASSALALRERLVDILLQTDMRREQADEKNLCFLSMEFLIGRSLENNLQNLGLLEAFREALTGLGGDLARAIEAEPDAALGTGDAGRMAACLLDSLASLNFPADGYGINYEYGLFRQEIEDGEQRELPDNWLASGTPWQIERPSEAVIVPCYGRIEHSTDAAGAYNPLWLDWETVIGVPHDFLIVGFNGRTVSRLRLFSARASQDFDLRIFQQGDYERAVEHRMSTERISKILHPWERAAQGRELRLQQEWFLAACAVRDGVRRFSRTHREFHELPQRTRFHLNGSSTALAVLELMRLLIDEQSLTWEAAWDVTRESCSFTSQSLGPDGAWDMALLEKLLPRHAQILREVNRRFLEEIAVWSPNDAARSSRMSLIEEGVSSRVRPAHLAVIGCHSTSGVSALHTKLLHDSTFPDFVARWPERFNNKSNGVSQRRWLLTANPAVAEILDRELGPAWPVDAGSFRTLESLTADAGFMDRMTAAKKTNKARLAAVVKKTNRIALDEESQFDVQAQPIESHRRQLLNVLHIAHEYLALAEDGALPTISKSYIFAGKAAPGSAEAQRIIRLIHAVAETINADPKVSDRLRVVFIPDFRVSLAEVIVPAADLSEQIATAGSEHAGTSAMKFALNGALTIGTFGGVNVEIVDAVGPKNAYIFGLKAEQVAAARNDGTHRPGDLYSSDPAIKRVVDAIAGGRFSAEDRSRFAWVLEHLVDEGDPWFHLADFHTFRKVRERAAADFLDRSAWMRRSVINMSRAARFSSDRTVSEYARDVWKLERV